jgi:hypothetical protein
MSAAAVAKAGLVAGPPSGPRRHPKSSKTALMHLRSQHFLNAPGVDTCLRRHLVTEGRFAGGAKLAKDRIGGVKMQIQRIKWQAIVIAASGIVTLGALAAAIGQEQTATAKSGSMNVGQTTTSTTPVVQPIISIAKPTMKAPRPKGF